MNLTLMIYSRNNLPKIKSGTCVIKLDEYISIGAYFIALHINGDNITYFDSFGVKHIPNMQIPFVLDLLILC